MISRPRGSWHLIALALVAAGVLVAAMLEIGPPSSAARTSREIVTAEKGIVQSTVTGSGNVEPGTEVFANFKTSGTLSNVFVKVGQHVNQGQLLAKLDSSSAELAVSEAQLSVDAAQDQLTAAQDGSSSSSGSGGASSASASSSPASIASAQAAVDSAELNLRSAQNALDETRLYAPTSGTIVSLQTTSPGAEISATGSSASSSTGSGSGSGSTSAGSAASGTGTSTAGSLGASSSSSSSGSSSTSGSGFAEIVNTKTMTMTVAFSESDIAKVKVGQPATATLDALSGVKLAAHVSSISTLGTDNDGVVSYDATLTLDQRNASVRPGMSASAAVVTNQAQGVTLPNSAITGGGSLSTVDVLRNGKSVSTPVVVGLKGDSRTQVVSGLKAGQQVVVTTTLPSLSSTPTSSSSTGALGGLRARLGLGGGGAGAFGGAAFGGGGFGGGGGAFGGAARSSGGG